MDIERLKELHDITVQKIINDQDWEKGKVMPKEIGEYWEDILELIANAEIARQSATSEEVQEAIEWLKGMERSYNLDRATGFASSKHDEAAEHCRVLLTALQAYQPWIPVSERLPDRWEHCLIYAKDNVKIAQRMDNNRWVIGTQSFTGVTHWKPLPEPPKGK